MQILYFINIKILNFKLVVTSFFSIHMTVVFVLSIKTWRQHNESSYNDLHFFIIKNECY